MTDRIVYPLAPRTDLVEVLHGVRVPDPFRTLENARHPDTIAWVDRENAITRRLLDGPDRDQLVGRLKQLHRFPRAYAPAARGTRLFFLGHDGHANQASLCVIDRRADAPPASIADARVLVDPNALSPDGTTAITAFEPDDAGDRVVYALSEGGSDLQQLQLLDVQSGRLLPDRIQWVKFASIAWTADGFFYTRFPEPGSVPPEHAQYFCRVFFHRLGDAQENDRLVFDRADAPEVVFAVDVTSDGRHLVVTSHRGSSDDAEVHVAELGVEGPVIPRPIVTGFLKGWHFIDGMAGHLFFHTTAGASRGRILRFDLDRVGEPPREVVPESADTIVDAKIAGGHLLIHSLRDASSRLDVASFDEAGKRAIELPGIGTIVSISADWHDERAFVTFMSFTTPPQVLEVVTADGTIRPVLASRFTLEPSAYETEQVWYPSKDGTPVSMFLVRGKIAKEARPSPVLLSGYGGFNISLTPTFRPADPLWLDAGGTIAIAHLRGGGEFGESWHQAGMLERKQNVFDDFIAAAEWLMSSGRTAPGGMAIEGASNGGLLVGAVLTQRPDLVGAAVCRVPVADMLRYHLFTVGRFWIPEYGSADDPQQFEYLRRYSPYHNVVDGVAYPPTLVMTADTDDRVDPGMAKKFAARLQEAVTSGGPILLRVEEKAGHGVGKPVHKQIDEQADIFAFLFRYLKLTPGQG